MRAWRGEAGYRQDALTVWCEDEGSKLQKGHQAATDRRVQCYLWEGIWPDTDAGSAYSIFQERRQDQSGAPVLWPSGVQFNLRFWLAIW